MIRKLDVRRIPPLFAQDRSEDRQAPQPRHLRLARGGRAARARSAVLQAALTRAMAKNVPARRVDAPQRLADRLRARCSISRAKCPIRSSIRAARPSNARVRSLRRPRIAPRSRPVRWRCRLGLSAGSRSCPSSVAIWRIQRQMVADIGSCFRRQCGADAFAHVVLPVPACRRAGDARCRRAGRRATPDPGLADARDRGHRREDRRRAYPSASSDAASRAGCRSSVRSASARMRITTRVRSRGRR